MALLMIVSAIICGWMFLLFKLSGMIIYDSNVAVSKTMTDEQLQHVCDSSIGLLCFAVIPMAVLTGMWVLAFLVERLEHNRLRKATGQPVAGTSGIEDSARPQR